MGYVIWDILQEPIENSMGKESHLSLKRYQVIEQEKDKFQPELEE